jgi:hypothetical protein
VYEHPIAGVFVDFFTVNEDDQSLTVSNAPAGEELDTPPGHEKLVEKNLALGDMYDLLLRKRPRGRYRRFDAKNFPEEFARAYAKEMDWRMERGGVTEDEVRRSAAAAGVASEEKIQQTTRKLQEDYARKRESLTRAPRD